MHCEMKIDDEGRAEDARIRLAHMLTALAANLLRGDPSRIQRVENMDGETVGLLKIEE